MYCVKKLKEQLYWIGGSDRRLSLFENVFPVPRGVSYNSYILLDEKTVVFDTVDHSIARQFIENISHLLNGKNLDYLVINHMEPDHCATIGDLLLRYPSLKLVTNAKAVTMLKQFYDFEVDSRTLVVANGDTLATGKHTLSFTMAPMVHWPEVMVTYDITDKVLFSADAFGTFGAIDGNIFADELNFEKDWLDDARRYYTNIVGKYGSQVQNALKAISGLEIKMICPLHGPVWRENIEWYVEKHNRWSNYTPEENAVMIAYASVYGDTENCANILAGSLAEKGVKNIKMYDVSMTHPSVIVAESFRCSHLVFASTTYNAGIFCNMETALLDIKAHNLQNRTVAIIENGSWAATAGKGIREILSSMKNINILENTLTLKSTLKSEQMEKLEEIAVAIYASMQETKI